MLLSVMLQISVKVSHYLCACA